MPAKKRSSTSSGKTARKVSKKAAGKAAGKIAKKVTKKASKKVAGQEAGRIAKKAARKSPGRPQKSRQQAAAISAEPRHEMIEKAAYFRSQKRNFGDGNAVADWLVSEKEVDELLKRAAHRE